MRTRSQAIEDTNSYHEDHEEYDDQEDSEDQDANMEDGSNQLSNPEDSECSFDPAEALEMIKHIGMDSESILYLYSAQKKILPARFGSIYKRLLSAVEELEQTDWSQHFYEDSPNLVAVEQLKVLISEISQKYLSLLIFPKKETQMILRSQTKALSKCYPAIIMPSEETKFAEKCMNKKETGICTKLCSSICQSTKNWDVDLSDPGLICISSRKRGDLLFAQRTKAIPIPSCSKFGLYSIRHKQKEGNRMLSVSLPKRMEDFAISSTELKDIRYCMNTIAIAGPRVLNSIHFTNFRIDERQVKRLFSACKNIPSVQFFHCAFEFEGTPCLSHSLSNTSLTHLSFIECDDEDYSCWIVSPHKFSNLLHSLAASDFKHSIQEVELGRFFVSKWFVQDVFQKTGLGIGKFKGKFDDEEGEGEGEGEDEEFMDEEDY
ncbi:unnamed protein product [Moneuplotes crassus]|uniref:Uncharacterized protein n=1 Tax=Euplotes crassus TaxID=5936 RepID=A0AAD1XDE6_EUPCR|nr:unnamed protein product [Moneuplotes crassus]